MSIRYNRQFLAFVSGYQPGTVTVPLKAKARGDTSFAVDEILGLCLESTNIKVLSSSKTQSVFVGVEIPLSSLFSGDYYGSAGVVAYQLWRLLRWRFSVELEMVIGESKKHLVASMAPLMSRHLLQRVGPTEGWFSLCEPGGCACIHRLVTATGVTFTLEDVSFTHPLARLKLGNQGRAVTANFREGWPLPLEIKSPEMEFAQYLMVRLIPQGQSLRR